MSNGMPGFQIILTKAGPILVPVPAGWTAVLDLTKSELVLAGPCDPAKTHGNVRGMKTERAEITLRYDENGTLKDKCRVRRWGQKAFWKPGPLPGGTHGWKYGSTGVSSKSNWVLQALAQNGRGL